MLCLPLPRRSRLLGHVLDGGEVRWRVLPPYVPLVVTKHHVPPPVQPILNVPAGADRMTGLGSVGDSELMY